MPDPKTHIEWDKLPATVESSAFRKTTDDYTFTLATERKHQDLVNNFLRRMSTRGVVFFVPCASDEQVEALLRSTESHSGNLAALAHGNAECGMRNAESSLVSVETLASALGLDPRTVQLDAGKWPEIRNSHGQYDLLRYCKALRDAFKDAQNAEGDALRNERVLITRAKREAAQFDNLERAGKLGNCDECIKVRIIKNATIKQRILALEKVLPQKTGGRTAEEQVPIIRNETRKLLIDLAATERPVGNDRGSGQDIPASSGPDRLTVGGRKQKTRRKD